MSYVLCTVSDGLRPSEVTVEVQDVDGQSEFLRVHREFVKEFEHRYYLPIGIVGQDNDLYLIELPHEANSAQPLMGCSFFPFRSSHTKAMAAT